MLTILGLVTVAGLRKVGNPLSQLCLIPQCALNDTVDELPNLPNSYDFREVGLSTVSEDQGNCGSCWAFVVKGVAEANVLSNQQMYRNTPFNGTARNLSISVQYIMNTSESAYYCAGGDAAAALWERKHAFTEELTANFPYTASKHPNPGSVKKPQPSIYPKDYLLPYEYYEMPILPETTEIIRIVNNSARTAISQQEISKVKQWLAMGVALIAEMYVGDDRAGYDFQNYEGLNALNGSCANKPNNHEVLITGYGSYKGTPAWVVKNSWGPKWGIDGYFYIEIGTNSYCIEEYVFAAVPQGFDLRNPHLYLEEHESAFSLERGVEGFDEEGGNYIDLELREAIIYNIIGWIIPFLFYGGMWFLQHKMDAAAIVCPDGEAGERVAISGDLDPV